MKLFNDYLPVDGVYDMRRDTTGVPEHIAQKINSNICFFSGGGGGGTTVTSGIPEKWQPQVTKFLDQLQGITDKKLSGQEEIVAGFDPDSEEALGYQSAAMRDKIAGRGAYDMGESNLKALQNMQGTNVGKASAGGALGSARSNLAMQKALAGEASKQSRARIGDIESGIKGLGDAGVTRQKQKQNVLDAQGNLIKGNISTLTGAAGTEKTTSGGGGTHICTALYELGDLSKRVYNYDKQYQLNVNENTYLGYSFWGKPLARKIKSRGIAYKLVKPIALAWANQMAYELSKGKSGKEANVLTKLFKKVGESICYCIGFVLNTVKIIEVKRGNA
jgi:hypothetical protein